MFKLLKKLQGAQRPAEDYEKIVLHEYQGQVISSEYNVNDPDEYPYHALFHHGVGKIKYIYDGEVVEEYEGEFDGGQYSGKGKLTKNGKVFEGEFSNNKFVG
ncbi:hypothetical protein N9X06_00720 [Paracoccaceae bacterium]|nr:hypothetical protein [Paracoccaceae bacterium]